MSPVSPTVRQRFHTSPLRLSAVGVTALALTWAAPTPRSVSQLYGAQLFWATAQAAQSEFASRIAATDAARYRKFIEKRVVAPGVTFRRARAKARQAMSASDARAAIDHYADAVALNREDPTAWLGLAQALEAITNPASNQEKYNLRVNAGGAAYRAYELATRTGMKARALAIVGRSLRSRSQFRPAINAFKASLDLLETPDVRAAYASLRAEKGFRIVNYDVEADAVRPRVCVRFSEALAKRNVDFAKFFSVNGRDPAAVRAEGRQICLDGFTHGERYAVTVRAGLPSEIGETLLKTAPLTVYVRDRSASVRFTGRNYVLPRTGQQGIPLVTVNTDRVALQMYRIGDRSIARAVLDGSFNQQLSRYATQELRDKFGAAVWSGTLDVRRDLNKDVTTAVSVSEALPTIKPGVYAMTARAEGEKTRNWSPRATQWFVISDLGVTALKGQDGIHAMVRSLETAKPVAGATVDL
ncbi:MAG: alpha-2-macroglobulin family protein, partial [Pseudomonadota bacterium]